MFALLTSVCLEILRSGAYPLLQLCFDLPRGGRIAQASVETDQQLQNRKETTVCRLRLQLLRSGIWLVSTRARFPRICMSFYLTIAAPLNLPHFFAPFMTMASFLVPLSPSVLLWLKGSANFPLKKT